MKKIFMIVFTINLFCFHCNLYAKSTDEVNMHYVFDEYQKVLLSNEKAYSPNVINYAVELVKNDPNSIETYFVFSLMNENTIDIDNVKIVLKYKELKEKFFSTITDFKNNPAEKIILLYLIFNKIEKEDSEIINDLEAFFFNKLSEIKKINENQDYLPLVTILMGFDKTKIIEILNEFKTNFSKHAFIPLVDLCLIEAKYAVNDNDEYIQMLNSWIDKYKHTPSPLGTSISLEAYILITHYYFEHDDNNSVRKYVELLEKECPAYYNLENMKYLIKKL